MLCNYMTARLEMLAEGGKTVRLNVEDMSHCSLEPAPGTTPVDIPPGNEDEIASCIPSVRGCGKAEGQILMVQRHGILMEYIQMAGVLE